MQHSDTREADALVEAQRVERRRRFYIDLRHAERRYGPGISLTQREMAKILDEGIPAWLVINARFSPNASLRARCEKGIFCLERLKKDLEP